jgi:hypothetical protein
VNARSSITSLLVVFVIVLAPALASAQDRGFAVGNFGLTFAENTDISYGLTTGFNVTPAVQIAGLQIEGKLPADYAAGGVRFIVQNRESVQVYLQGEGGVGRVTSELRFFEAVRSSPTKSART